MTVALSEQQGVLLEPMSPVERLNAAGGLVRLEDLAWPIFDAERVTTMAHYMGEIGSRMADEPREDAVTDSALGLYGADFAQAQPANLEPVLYVPEASEQKLKKSVVTVSGGHCDLDWNQYPGRVPYSTGVSVSEDIYEELVRSNAAFANQIDNNTQRANLDEQIVEARVNLAGESVIYAFAKKHKKLKNRYQILQAEHEGLVDFNATATKVNPYHTVATLEPLREAGLTPIIEMVRIACKRLGYGTNQTRNTINATESNLHRTPDPRERRKWIAKYSLMAVRYNEAVMGKVNQSIWACIEGIYDHREQAFNSIDREYTDD